LTAEKEYATEGKCHLTPYCMCIQLHCLSEWYLSMSPHLPNSCRTRFPVASLFGKPNTVTTFSLPAFKTSACIQTLLNVRPASSSTLQKSYNRTDMVPEKQALCLAHAAQAANSLCCLFVPSLKVKSQTFATEKGTLGT